MAALEIRNLKATVEDTPILQGVNLTVEPGKIHALMGPNGSGKSTLSNVLMGHPKYTVTAGEVIWKRRNILKLSPDERAQLGLFLAFQYPQEIAGVSLPHFLRTAVNAIRASRRQKEFSVLEFRRAMKAQMKILKIPDQFEERYLNEGFSGGEKKRAEMLQMGLLKPEIAIMDETDSGLDIDALRVVAAGVHALKKAEPGMGVLLITHYQRILNYIKPDRVHVMVKGKIVESGGADLVEKLEKQGYDWLSEAKPRKKRESSRKVAA